ncbi:hypothetical protein [Fodinicola acaciae]|uniref:hypothetical protein n=1 Tax=Fodinicola acaciae TaxID=2681555 RepID=UPI0013D55AD4|nr:hypothetical protein [Fodinicola acaciae]
MDGFTEMNAELRRIFRGEQAYGDGPAADQARRFRMEKLLPFVIEQAKKNSTLPDRQVDLLVSLSGFSPETTILACKILEPKRLMTIGSDETRDSVDVIQEVLGYRASQLDMRYVDPTDPLHLYRHIQDAADNARPASGGERPYVMIDITGGKKVMSASAALAASQLDLPMCYIESKFDPEMRQAVPGTETLLIVPNPTSLFADREMDAAGVAFRIGNYAEAQYRYKKVADNGYRPVKARFFRDLSDLYQAWCDLDFEVLPERVCTMRARLEDASYTPVRSLAQRISKQVDFVEDLVEKREGWPLLLNFYLLGKHYQRLSRHDFAALLYYRTLEYGLALRLEKHAPGFSCRRPDYSLLADDVSGLAERFSSAASKVTGHSVTGLPARVGLIDAAVLLRTLDENAAKFGVGNDKAISNLRLRAEARNSSVLAHGTDCVTAGLCEDLGGRALNVLRALWTLENAERRERLDSRIATLQFVGEL